MGEPGITPGVCAAPNTRRSPAALRSPLIVRWVGDTYDLDAVDE